MQTAAQEPTPATPTVTSVPPVISVSTSTPQVATASTAATTVAASKTFTGLVDYPSFNQADESEYSCSDSDSDIELAPALTRNGGHKTSKSPSKTNGKSSPKKKSSEKQDSYANILWPSRNEQMLIDKIACYIVKNGSKFEQAVKARGKKLTISLISFLNSEVNKYFQNYFRVLTDLTHIIACHIHSICNLCLN